MPVSPLASSLAERYRLGREIGSGGMATVFLAHDLKHGRDVAIKVLKHDVASAIGRDRFLREIETVARLTHPHILPLHDSGAADGQLYYVTPYIEGESLRARLNRDKQLPVEEALRLSREIAAALGHAHHHGLVHRDIKPENVLLSDGIALVADFGIARAVSAASEDDAKTRPMTAANVVLGTPGYMSPEQASGEEVDGRTDLYALACVVFEMLAGRPPFLAPTSHDLIRMHRTAEAPSVTEFRSSVPAGIATVIARGLAKLPSDRYATVARFIEAMDAAAKDEAMTAPRSQIQTATPNNVPAQRTRFIGREKELEDCSRSLAGTRLLTVTGIGGCGKTRLALQLAERMLEDYPDGVWFVDLAPLGDGNRVIEAIAASLEVREEPGKRLLESLGQRLRGKRSLLILDNCEHLLSACAGVVDALLSAAEGLQILATSREGLGVDGERLFALRSLSIPSPEATRDPHAVEESEAARLFVDRAQLAVREFTLTESNAGSVAEICRRLDGIPLAIELAAARVKILSVDQIRARLDDRFRLLTGGSKTALPRQQTLRATIQWSYDQLTAEEQQLFQVLSVFAGGWKLGSAARVATGDVDEFAIMDRLARLVDRSLVLVERTEGDETRYGFLETVRQYAQERLHEAGGAEEGRQEHLAEFQSLAEHAYSERFTREEHWAAVLEREHENLRAALRLAQSKDAERYLELAGALAWFWQARSHLLEGREHVTAALAASAADPPRPARARALWGAANMLSWQGDTKAALPQMQEALAMWRGLGDLPEVALALEGMGWVQLLDGKEESARVTLEECLRLQRERGDPVLVNRAMVALAQVLVALGEVGPARELSSEIIAYSKTIDDRRSEHFGWHFLADCALTEGTCEESLSLYQKSLVLAHAIGDRLEMSFEVQGVAMSLAGLGSHEAALRLAGSAKGEWERIGADVHMRFWDALMERYIGVARQSLDPEVADRAWQEGRALGFEHAMSLALKGPLGKQAQRPNGA